MRVLTSRGATTRRAGLLIAALLAGTALTVPPLGIPPASAETSRAAASAGAAKIGTASYAVPAGAVHVAPWGTDSASGRADRPVRTLGRALTAAPAGGTVVLRGGVYNQQAAIDKPVTIQNHPGEAVWLDGSTTVRGWVRDGKRWRHDGWTTRFDHSPTYTRGAPDLKVKDWQFLNPAHPMAAHPDQVWIDGRRLTQAASLKDVAPGRFFVDEARSRLYVGSDPSGATVAASNRAQALNIRAPGVVVRGIGIRRFAPSVWHVGGITIEKPNSVFENVHVHDMATTGISVLASGVQLRNVTVAYSGMLGIHGRYADRLSLVNVLARRNNLERFNIAPVSGGAKIGQSRDLTVTDSDFSDNYGPGFWADLSVYNSRFRGSHFNRNSGDGLFLEISARAVVGNSLFLHNRRDGIKVNNTSNVRIWNNTFVGNSRSIWLAQDGRRNTNRSDPAVDPRRPWPDPAMPWQLDNVMLGNNVIGLPRSTATCILCVEDYSHRESAAAMRIRADGNVYNRTSAAAPRWLAVWSRGRGDPAVFTTLSGFRAKTRQEARGREYVGRPVVSTTGVLSRSVRAQTDRIGLRLPADVAGAIGRPAGTRHLGAWSTGWTKPAALDLPRESGGATCAAFRTELRRLVNPATQANLLTKWADEAETARSDFGFTEDRGVLGRVVAGAGTGVVPVWRLNRGGDFAWAADGPDAQALVGQGYAAQFVDFYASASDTACLEPVHLLRYGTAHRLADADEAAALVDSGWTRLRVAFYADVD